MYEQDGIKRLEVILNNRYKPFAGGRLSYALAKQENTDGEWELITARLFLSEEEEQVQAALSYRELRLEEVWLEASQILPMLEDLRGGQSRLPGLEHPVGLNYFGAEYHVNRPNSFSGWPEWIISGRRDSQCQGRVSYRAVVSRDGRPFRSGNEAVMSFVWPQHDIRHHSGEIPFLGEFKIVAPDTRGRIREAEWSSGQVIVKLDYGDDPGNLQLQALAMLPDAEEVLDPLAVRDALTLDPPPNTEAIDLFLLHGDHDLLGHVRLDRPGDEFSALAGTLKPEVQAGRDLEIGEGEQIEYKPFIKPTDQKESEIVETIVAFSNSGGGRIYVGVNDDGLTQGEHALRSTFSAPADEALVACRKRIEKLVRERVKPVPEARVFHLHVKEAPIVFIDIPSGNDRPYATDRNIVYLRKGASNYVADPRTELPHLTKDSVVVRLSRGLGRWPSG